MSRRLLRRFAHRSAPPRQAEERLRLSLAQRGVLGGTGRILKRHGELPPQAEYRVRSALAGKGVFAFRKNSPLVRFGQPQPDAEERLRRALEDRLKTASRNGNRLRGGLTLAAAAALLLGAWLALRPRAPSPLDQVLRAPEAPEKLRTVPRVSLSYRGEGRLLGTTRDPMVQWQEGELQVRYRGAPGSSLRVETPEATVLVTGTVFQVRRSALGTRVQVDEGEVLLRCRVQDEQHLQAGTSGRCDAPTVLLKRARDLHGQDEAGALRLVEQGLALAGGPRGELQAVRLETLEALGRASEARQAAESCLADTERCLGGDLYRLPEIRRTAARLAYEQEGCAAALPQLEILVGSEAALAADLLQLARCFEEQDPQRACRLAGRAPELSESEGLELELRGLREICCPPSGDRSAANSVLPE